ncbi:putative structural protein [Polaromonas phage Tiera]|nr:putative structural protein [Polaromonas phage Tiera]
MATTSRYATAAEAQAASQPTGTVTAGNTTGNSTTTQNGSSSSTQNTSTKQQNMTPEAMSALNQLILQLATGGTPELKAQNAARDAQLGTLQNSQQAYSKDAAFADAQGLMAQTMKDALAKLLPTINAGSLGAGASQSSMRALLTQKAAQDAATAASAQGLGAAVSYGGVANGIGGNINQLLSIADPVTAALLASLNTAKGAVSNSQGTTTTNGTTSSTTNQATTGSTGETKAISYGNTVNPAAANSSPLYFGPVQTDGELAAQAAKGSQATTQLLQSLTNQNSFSGFTDI